MAQVRFKRGTQSALDTLLAGLGSSTTAVEGSFYLTTDTDRLYFAQSSSELVELNQFIRIIDSGSLPTKSDGVKDGDIYYMSVPNVLAIYKNGSWQQINPDTNTELVNSSTAISVNDMTGGASVGVTVTDNNSHSVNGSFAIVGGENVAVSTSGQRVVVSATDTNTTYTVSAASATTGAKLHLEASSGTSSDVLFVGGSGISVEEDNGSVKIVGSNPITSVGNAFSTSGMFVITLGVDGGSAISSTASALVPTIKYGSTTSAALTAKFISGEANLDIYTKSEIDTLLNNKLSSFDAMSYKGSLASSASAIAAIGATGANAPVAGDTYKFASSFTFGTGSDVPTELQGVPVKTGDLLIASGADDNITWEIVPSGDDQYVSATANAANNSLTLYDGLAGSAFGGVQFFEDNTTGNSIIDVDSAVSGNVLGVTLKHGAAGAGTAITVAAATTATTLGGSATSTTGRHVIDTLSVPAVTSISKDVHGHVTTATAATYTFVDTHAHLDNIVTSSQATGTSRILYSYQIGLDNSAQTKSNNLVITSDNLKLTAVSENSGALNGFNINLEWESFS